MFSFSIYDSNPFSQKRSLWRSREWCSLPDRPVPEALIHRRMGMMESSWRFVIIHWPGTEWALPWGRVRLATGLRFRLVQRGPYPVLACQR